MAAISPIPSTSQALSIGASSPRAQAAVPKPKVPEDIVQLSPAATAAGAQQNNLKNR